MLFWHLEEFNKFISVVDDVTLNALFNLLYQGGYRVGEALALTWNDVNFATKTIPVKKNWNFHTQKITTPKTSNSYRDVILPDKCFDAIMKLYEFHKKCDGFSMDRYLFGFLKPLDDNYIRRKKEKYCEMANVKVIRTHDFRHSHVSLLIKLNFSAFDIAKRLGHTVDMVNNRYDHWFDNAQVKMVNKLNSL